MTQEKDKIINKLRLLRKDVNYWGNTVKRFENGNWDEAYARVTRYYPFSICCQDCKLYFLHCSGPRSSYWKLVGILSKYGDNLPNNRDKKRAIKLAAVILGAIEDEIIKTQRQRDVIERRERNARLGSKARNIYNNLLGE